MFSVCTVAYGDYPDLLRKTLDSIQDTRPPGLVTDIRIGLNDVSQATFDYVMEYCGNRALDTNCYVYVPPENVGKYPLMRRMFYDQERPLDKLVMWFDDDSYLDPQANHVWWREAEQQGQLAVVMGVVHTIRQRGNQWRGIQTQPWARLKVHAGHSFRFATGGWWTAKRDFLTEWGYPFWEIHHNGGDSILGELVRHRAAAVSKFKLAKCHCESCLKKPKSHPPGVVHVNVGGRQGRRGLGRKNEVYPWQNFGVRNNDLSYHNFELKIYRFERS
jgi:hypothetical protein